MKKVWLTIAGIALAGVFIFSAYTFYHQFISPVFSFAPLRYQLIIK